MAMFPLMSRRHDRSRKERGTKKERDRCKGRENYRGERLRQEKNTGRNPSFCQIVCCF